MRRNRPKSSARQSGRARNGREALEAPGSDDVAVATRDQGTGSDDKERRARSLNWSGGYNSHFTKRDDEPKSIVKRALDFLDLGDAVETRSSSSRRRKKKKKKKKQRQKAKKMHRKKGRHHSLIDSSDTDEDRESIFDRFDSEDNNQSANVFNRLNTRDSIRNRLQRSPALTARVKRDESMVDTAVRNTIDESNAESEDTVLSHKFQRSFADIKFKRDNAAEARIRNRRSVPLDVLDNKAGAAPSGGSVARDRAERGKSTVFLEGGAGGAQWYRANHPAERSQPNPLYRDLGQDNPHKKESELEVGNSQERKREPGQETPEEGERGLGQENPVVSPAKSHSQMRKIWKEKNKARRT